MTISTLPHVTCVKWNAIAAVDMKTMLDTISLLELELNNQNLANDLRLFFQELESSNHYIFNVHINVKKERLPRCLHIEYKEWNFINIVLHIFSFLGTFFIFLYFMDVAWVLDLPSWRSCTLFCIKIKAQPNFGEIVWNKKNTKISINMWWLFFSHIVKCVWSAELIALWLNFCYVTPQQLTWEF